MLSLEFQSGSLSFSYRHGPDPPLGRNVAGSIEDLHFSATLPIRGPGGSQKTRQLAVPGKLGRELSQITRLPQHSYSRKLAGMEFKDAR